VGGIRNIFINHVNFDTGVLSSLNYKTFHSIIHNAFSDDETFSHKSNQSYSLIIFSQTHQNIRNEYLKAHKMNFDCVSKRVEYDYIKRRE